MSELLREIEEDIRSERMQRLWDRFGKLMIRLSIAVVLGTAVGVAWKYYRHVQHMEQTSAVLRGTELMQQGKFKEAKAAFEQFEGESTIYADMAMLQKAMAQEALEDQEGAKKTYQELAARNAENAYVELARLLSAKETDAPLHVVSSSPFSHLQEERSAWQLLKSGKKEEAIQKFMALRNDAEAPRSLRARAAIALSTLVPPGTEIKAVSSE